MSEQSRLVYRTRDELIDSVDMALSALHNGPLKDLPEPVYDRIMGIVCDLSNAVSVKADALADALDKQHEEANREVIENLKRAEWLLRSGGIEHAEQTEVEEYVSCALIEAGGK